MLAPIAILFKMVIYIVLRVFDMHILPKPLFYPLIYLCFFMCCLVVFTYIKFKTCNQTFMIMVANIVIKLNPFETILGRIGVS